MTPFEKFHAVVEAALTRLEVLLGRPAEKCPVCANRDVTVACGHWAHPEFCMCPECVCVRGVRDELESYAKGAERAAKKKRAPQEPTCAMERMISWSGCNAEIACLHYRDDEAGTRPTALCRACSRASVKKRGKAK